MKNLKIIKIKKLNKFQFNKMFKIIKIKKLNKFKKKFNGIYYLMMKKMMNKLKFNKMIKNKL